ncbi:MAG: glycosyl hydrolase [Caldilineaceae bacterium]
MNQPDKHPTPNPQSPFTHPPTEYGIMPFWFWNDDLDEAELLRQIGEFHAKGFGGFLLHPRVGLARRIGYLTEEYFRLAKLAVAEAARLGMKVVLYDEGSYPSGSAQGKVVAADPTHASRCIVMQQKEISGPARGYWHPNPGRGLDDELLCVIAAREAAPNTLDPDSLTRLPVQEPELVHYDLPAGQWRLIAVWHVYSGGAIRGVHTEEDDGHALAPAAGDLLNPAAVASFIRLTHDQYYAHLHAYFGDTIVAMFTDEPGMLGRGAKRRPDPWPFTHGFVDELQTQWDADVLCWLPALWLDCGPRSDEFRQMVTRALYDRLERVFYGAQSQWCVDHGIALTGHPAESNDFGALRQFQWPGQDMVWRWVTPGAASALEGAHSCAPKCASSAAALQDSRRNASEALGAYGWQLTLDEAKWLLDWHLVRGNNLFYLHACFYSVRGRRAFESEPDIGIHNVWWPYFGLLGDYLRRVCWLLSDCTQVCQVAILTDGNAAAWRAAKVLYQNQIDFIYIDEPALAQARVENGALAIGNQRFRTVICDPPDVAGLARLAEFVQSGGRVLTDWSADTLAAALLQSVERDVDFPNAPELRFIHVHKAGYECYFFVNEGEEPIAGAMSLAAVGALECWDPLDGSMRPWPATAQNGRLHTHLHLARRQGLILAVDPNGEPQTDWAKPPQPGNTILPLVGPWQAANADGESVAVPCPGDWAQTEGWETFSGTLTFRTAFSLSATQMEQPLFLDLGRVGDIAEVHINDKPVGVRAWAPYVLRIDAACQSGDNQLEVRVTNSAANFYEGMQAPSGLLTQPVVRSAS